MRGPKARRSGSRRARPARSRSSATAPAPSPSKAITTRFSSSTTSSRGRQPPTTCAWTASRSGRRRTDDRDRLSAPGRTSGSRGSCSAPAASVRPSRPSSRRSGLRTFKSRASMHSGRTRSNSNGARASGPTRSCCSVTRSTQMKSPRRHSTSFAAGATPISRPANRSPTSRSTPASTANRGRTPTSAGCSPLCRPR